MTCRRRPTWFLCGVLVVGLSAGAVAAELPQLIEKVKAVGQEAKNAAGAQAALAELSAGKPATILPLLAALDGATPVAANYLRSAVETIAQRTIDQGNKLPAREIEQF